MIALSLITKGILPKSHYLCTLGYPISPYRYVWETTFFDFWDMLYQLRQYYIPQYAKVIARSCPDRWERIKLNALALRALFRKYNEKKKYEPLMWILG